MAEVSCTGMDDWSVLRCVRGRPGSKAAAYPNCRDGPPGMGNRYVAACLLCPDCVTRAWTLCRVAGALGLCVDLRGECLSFLPLGPRCGLHPLYLFRPYWWCDLPVAQRSRQHGCCYGERSPHGDLLLVQAENRYLAISDAFPPPMSRPGTPTVPADTPGCCEVARMTAAMQACVREEASRDTLLLGVRCCCPITPGDPPRRLYISGWPAGESCLFWSRATRRRWN